MTRKAKAKKSARGGTRNLGRLMANNTSGLPGISFKMRTGGKYATPFITVCSSWTGNDKVPRQSAHSIAGRTPEEVLALAFAGRIKAGKPVPPMALAVAKLEEFLKINGVVDTT